MIQLNLGKFGEDKALTYLKSLDYQLIERNHANHYGEIDLIVRKNNELVFVEVKTVCVDRGYDPVEQMTPRKLIHLRNTINGYLSFRHIPPNQIYRLDFIGIIVDNNTDILKFDHRPSIGFS